MNCIYCYNSYLWLVDDWCIYYIIKGIYIGYCKGFVLNFFWFQFIVMGVVSKIVYGFGQVNQVQMVCFFDYWYDQVIIWQGCCYFDIDIFFVDDFCVINRNIDYWVIVNCLYNCFDEDRCEGDFFIKFLLEGVFIVVVLFYNWGYVGFYERSNVW